MATNSLSRAVWRISLPIILVEATETLDHLIDTLFLARVGITELGAIAVADSVLLLFLILPLSLVDGLQIITARRAGQRRHEAVGAVFNQGLLMVIGLCLAATVALKIASPMVANWLVKSNAVGQAVDGYLQIDAYSIVLAGLTFAYSALLTSLGRTRALIPATIIMVVTDIVLNYLFIFGKFGCPALGMRGAAVGSLGAEFLTVVFLTLYIRREFRSKPYGFFHFGRREHRMTGLLTRMSLPIAAQCFLEDLRWFIFFIILEGVSTTTLAIANIVYTCYVVFWIPAEGFSETSCSMVSRFVGGNRSHRIGRLLRVTTHGAVLATIPFILVALIFPQWILAVFAPGSELLAQSSASLRVVALAMLIAIPGEMWFTAVVGTGDTAAALGIEFILTVVMVAMTWFAAIQLAWPVALVWLSVPIGWMLCLAMSYGWIKSGIWKRLEV
jgi:putative MATE family efflux protein